MLSRVDISYVIANENLNICRIEIEAILLVYLGVIVEMLRLSKPPELGFSQVGWAVVQWLINLPGGLCIAITTIVKIALAETSF